MIDRSCVDRIWQTVRVEEILADFLPLKKAGANLKCKSPFTKEKTASFTVSPAKQIWKDFSSGKGGNWVKFLTESQGFSYVEALKYAAEKYGIYIEYDDSVDKEELKKKQQTFDTYQKLIEKTADYYSQKLQKLSPNHPAIKEVRKNRFYSNDDIIQWGIGYCGKDAGVAPILKQHGKTEIGRKLGILSEKNNDRYFDRIIFPIHNERGQVIGLAGRRLSDNQKYPKYINPADTPIYQKKYVWYGLHHAAESIRKSGIVNIVEGYTDVIAAHKYGATNTIAACSTNITTDQIRILSRYADAVRLVFDNDEGTATKGLKKALDIIDTLTAAGFELEICILPISEDPDSLSRKLSQSKSLKDAFRIRGSYGVHRHEITPKSKKSSLKKLDFSKLTSKLYSPALASVFHNGGMQAVLDHLSTDAIIYKGEFILNSVDKSKPREVAAAFDSLTTLIAKVPDDTSRMVYIDYFNDKTTYTKSEFKKQIAELIKKNGSKKLTKRERFNAFLDARKEDYNLPEKCIKQGLDWELVKEDIVKYGIFSFQNALYARRGDEPIYDFKKVSNFSIRVIQHMEDEKRPAKLVEMVNEKNRRRVFDTDSDDFVTQISFKKMASRRGNYNWQGTEYDFNRLNAKLMDEMGDGRMLVQLGWQPEGVWVMNNAIIADGKRQDLDENGCFKWKDHTYYVPSANPIYARNPAKYQNQKRAVFLEPEKPLKYFLSLMKKVHREHSYNAMLFTVATAFSDIIFDRTTFFPMLFLYGEPSTGKDNLIECCQSFFGHPQQAVTITGKANTDKGKIRKFAEFYNMIVHMSEYETGNSDTDQMLKGLWDRSGYTRGNVDSYVGTETVPILSTCVFTGNYYPTVKALVTRFIGEEMEKNKFTHEEKERFSELKDLSKSGVSGYLEVILKHRKTFLTDFKKTYKLVGTDLKDHLQELNLIDRMIQNAAVLGATYKLTCDTIPYPFSYEEWKAHIKAVMQTQSDKMSTSDATSKFWEVFSRAVKNKRNRIKHGQDFSISGTGIYINFRSVFQEYRPNYREMYDDAPLTPAVLKDKLKKSDAFIKAVNSHYFGSGHKTSAYLFNLDKLKIKKDLLNSIDYAENDDRRYNNNPADPDAFHTPSSKHRNELNDSDSDFFTTDDETPAF